MVSVRVRWGKNCGIPTNGPTDKAFLGVGFADMNMHYLLWQVLSPFWVVLFYFTLIMLGIAQALALFHSVIQVMIIFICSDHQPR